MTGSHKPGDSSSLATRETKPGYLPAADAPHHVRNTDRNPRAAKRAERMVSLMFIASMLLTVTAIVAFVLIPADEFIRVPVIGEPQALHLVLGLTIGGAILLVGIGAIYWAEEADDRCRGRPGAPSPEVRARGDRRRSRDLPGRCRAVGLRRSTPSSAAR